MFDRVSPIFVLYDSRAVWMCDVSWWGEGALVLADTIDIN